MSARLSARLTRLLNMIPYLRAHPGVGAARAAADLGVTTQQLYNDLNQLWMCGLPGYGPGDLIDLSFADDAIEVTYSAGMDRPLRLTALEATTLTIALHSLAELPGTVDPTAAYGALAKIEAAAGRAVADRGGPPTQPEPPTAATVRSAVRRGHALRITYYSAGRDTVGERTVDPIRIVLADRHSYLEAFSREIGATRKFRLDRIDDAVELDERARPPTQVDDATSGQELFGDDASLQVARVRVAADCAWVLDQFPAAQPTPGPDGTVDVTLRYATPEWMVRLLLGLGSGATVLEPAELATAVRTRAAAALAAYNAASTEHRS